MILGSWRFLSVDVIDMAEFITVPASKWTVWD